VKAHQVQTPRASDRFDPGVAHPARVYNYWLGGKDHYEADRAVGDEVARCRPHVVAGARANRAFLARAVRYLAADCGIRQFLDIDTGLPAPGSTHELAQQVAPECAVAYVDNDPLVLVYARALLTSGPKGRCGYIGADLRDPAAILAQRRPRLTSPSRSACCYWPSCTSWPPPTIRQASSRPSPGRWLPVPTWSSPI